MDCPVCSKAMVEKDFGISTKVNVCEGGCKGIWFDYLELRMLDEKNEGTGEALQAALHYPRTNDNNRAPLNCPKCGSMMHAHKYERDREVNVDECYSCGGFFLDSGELKDIRDRYMSDEEQDNYVHQLIGGIPACNKADVVGRENDRAKAARNVGVLLRNEYWGRLAA